MTILYFENNGCLIFSLNRGLLESQASALSSRTVLPLWTDEVWSSGQSARLLSSNSALAIASPWALGQVSSSVCFSFHICKIRSESEQQDLGFTLLKVLGLWIQGFGLAH